MTAHRVVKVGEEKSWISLRRYGDRYLPSRLKRTKRSATMPYQHPQAKLDVTTDKSESEEVA